MAFQVAQGESFTIRRKVFKLFGSAFHIYDAQNNIVGYCKQKAFRLREDLRIFTDESCSAELFRIGTQQILDIGATYTVTRSVDSAVLGMLKRKGMKSLIRDEWMILSPEGREIGLIQEDSGALAILRRVVELTAALVPQKFNVIASDGTPVAQYRQHFNPFVFRLGVAYFAGGEQRVNQQFVLAAACLIGAIEGRQK